MADERARGGRRDAGALRGDLRERLPAADAAAALLSGDAWRRYCDALRQAGEHLLAANPGAGPATRAEGMLYLLGLVRGGIGQALELADPRRPRFFRNPDSSSRWGAENADNQYLWARIDPALDYCIRGERGSAFDFLIEVKEGYMQLGDERNFATLTADAVACDDEGRFEIRLSGTRPPAIDAGRWLPLDPDARYVAIRQYLCDWQRETPARFTIECLTPGEVAPADPANVAARLEDAGEWTLASARFWTEWTDALREGFVPGVLPPARKYAGGADDIYYGNAFYRLGPDEALVVDTDPPDARYWQFQLCDRWFRSADWAERTTSINHLQARLDGDGRFRCVVAHRDPGVANWLDTAGETEGVLQYRWVWSRDNPVPRAETVAFDAIRAHLPADTPRLGAQERVSERRLRRRHRERREPPC